MTDHETNQTWTQLRFIPGPKSPGHQTFQLRDPRPPLAVSAFHAYVHARGDSERARVAVDVADGGVTLRVDASEWQPGRVYELSCEQRGDGGDLVGYGCVSVVHDAELAKPTYADGPVPAPLTPRHSPRIVLDGAVNPGSAVSVQVLGDDCQPYDLDGVDVSAEFVGSDKCCREVEVTQRRTGTQRVLSLVCPPELGTVRVFARKSNGEEIARAQASIVAAPPRGGVLDGGKGEPPPRGSISLRRADVPPTRNQDFYSLIRGTTNAMSFASYARFMDLVFCGDRPQSSADADIGASAQPLLGSSKLALPFPGVDAYRTLKAATEVFLLLNSGAVAQAATGVVPLVFQFPGAPTKQEEEARMGHALVATFPERISDYLVTNGDGLATLPYLDIIRSRLTGIDVVETTGGRTFDCNGILRRKLTSPLLIELIWSYWLEEAMLVQSMLAISQRFENRSPAGDRDPLAQLTIDPLRTFGHFMWGYVQDQQHRLSVFRRAHEYMHQYGLTLHGKAVQQLRPSDRRSKFLEAFHHLLHQCVLFYRQDDDTTVVADGFPVLNALKEVHYVLAYGAHNQFGDLPATARGEMLIEQWLLARPEVREFLGGRVMVPFPEPWMDRVETVKTLKGWSDTSVVHFRDLAVFGEQIVLSVRWDSWSTRTEPEFAANWARYWRAEIQQYIHAYRAATGVDLSSEVTDQAQLSERFLPPSVHLSRRLSAQVQGRT